MDNIFSHLSERESALYRIEFVLNNARSEIAVKNNYPATYLREVYHSERNEAAWDRQSNGQAVPGRATTLKTPTS